jgi:hypothetical protein
MTRKDYILIAEAIEAIRADFGDNPVSLDVVAEELASALQADNARFDTARFLTACGVK